MPTGWPSSWCPYSDPPGCVEVKRLGRAGSSALEVDLVAYAQGFRWHSASTFVSRNCCGALRFVVRLSFASGATLPWESLGLARNSFRGTPGCCEAQEGRPAAVPRQPPTSRKTFPSAIPVAPMLPDFVREWKRRVGNSSISAIEMANAGHSPAIALRERVVMGRGSPRAERDATGSTRMDSNYTSVKCCGRADRR